ncbi:MAG: hypothetical protein IJO43_02635 [Bacilli bacterium]|nr:hypothetical protein [Bacilli bacterium]
MDNDNKYYDLEYMCLVRDILENEEFNKTKNITHHGLNRFDHCVRVSYYSYKVTKFFKLGYKDVARAGLLHDFFFVDNNDIDTTKRIDVLVNHPKYALINSKKHFELNDREEDIITSHMFPVAFKVPKYIESWIVDIVDNAVAISEALYITRKHLSVAVNFLVLIVLNYWR